jgi:hypothetical protein
MRYKYFVDMNRELILNLIRYISENIKSKGEIKNG